MTMTTLGAIGADLRTCFENAFIYAGRTVGSPMGLYKGGKAVVSTAQMADWLLYADQSETCKNIISAVNPIVKGLNAFFCVSFVHTFLVRGTDGRTQFEKLDVTQKFCKGFLFINNVAEAAIWGCKTPRLYSLSQYAFTTGSTKFYRADVASWVKDGSMLLSSSTNIFSQCKDVLVKRNHSNDKPATARAKLAKWETRLANLGDWISFGKEARITQLIQGHTHLNPLPADIKQQICQHKVKRYSTAVNRAWWTIANEALKMAIITVGNIYTYVFNGNSVAVKVVTSVAFSFNTVGFARFHWDLDNKDGDITRKHPLAYWKDRLKAEAALAAPAA